MDPSHFYPASQWAKMGIEITIDKAGGSEMKITTLGIDLAKNVFQLHGVDEKLLPDSITFSKLSP